MKNFKLVPLIILLMSIWMLTIPAFAQTPDGETPAEESVCTFLQDHTPGLYGLCLAYCEAQDAHLLSPGGDPKELNIPNQRILENYRNKMRDGDPDMPCVQTTPCPCWTQADLDYMDAPVDHANDSFFHACQEFVIPNDFSREVIEDVERDDNGRVSSINQFYTAHAYGTEFYSEWFACSHYMGNYKGVNYSLTSLLITQEEYEVCAQSIINEGSKRSVSGEYWDCWDN